MANQNYQDVLVDWLENAYSFENAVVGMLENQIERASGFPDLRSQLQEHREASRRHANTVESCIERLGGDISQVRESISKFLGDTPSKLVGIGGDSVVKDTIVGSIIEQYEISTYTAIITLAERLGDDNTADRCREILDDEQQMHDYLTENIENIVNQAYERELLGK